MRFHTAACGILTLFSIPNAVMASSPAPNSCSPDQGRRVSFTATEGSQMNLDVSPEGKWIAFDLLGDIYTMPVSGGQAKRITRGNGWDKRPVWSPNGKTIAFISDRLGPDQVFVISAGSADSAPIPLKNAINTEKESLSEGAIRSAEWLNENELIVDGKVYSIDQENQLGARGHGFPGDSYFSTGEAVYYFTPAADSSLVRTQEEMRIGSSVWRMARGVSSQVRGIQLNLMMGSEAPAVSKDGRWLVYISRSPTAEVDRLKEGSGAPSEETDIDTINVLDTRSGAEKVLIGPGISKGWRSNGANRHRIGLSTNVRYDVSPDSASLYVAYGGHIHKVDIPSGTNTMVPVSAEVEQCLQPMAKSVRARADSQAYASNIRDAALSNNGKELLFVSGRRLYVMDMSSGRNRVLLRQDEGQFQPSYSPDGKWIAYVTWSDAEGGHIWKVRSNGTGAKRLTSEAGFYQAPTWSPDGKSIAFQGSGDLETRRFGNENRVFQGSLEVLSVRDGVIKNLDKAVRFGTKISFSGDASRIYYSPYVGPFSSIGRASSPLQLFSVAPDGSDQRDEHVEKFYQVHGYASARVHPTRSTIAAVKAGNLYLIDCPSFGRQPDAFLAETCREIKLTNDGGNDPAWREGGEVLEWSFADKYYRVRLGDLLGASTVSSGQDISEPLQSGSAIQVLEPKLAITMDGAKGTLLLKGAKIITMRGDEVFEKGNIVVHDNRILSIGVAVPKLPADVKIIDVAGKTIIPGLIDAHAHFTALPRDILAKNHWQLLVSLAFGTTTAKDPSNGGDHGFAYDELLASGDMLGPRRYSTTAMISGQLEPLSSYEQARDRARRLQRLGAIFVKYHTGFNRQQRDWIIQSARSSGMSAAAHMPTETIGSSRLNLSTIVDGATSSEHELTSENDLFMDVSTFIDQSDVFLCFAPLAAGGGYHSRYWRSMSDDPRLVNFYRGAIPQLKLPPASLSGSLAPLREEAEANAKFLAVLSRNSEQVLIGSHGDYPGVEMHWEMWAHVKGGMPNHKALRAATLNVAKSLNLDAELGSLEPGKFADLLILDRDPLEDIRNTLTIEMVMKDGVLRDSYSLDEIWPKVLALPKWEMPDRPVFIGTPNEESAH